MFASTRFLAAQKAEAQPDAPSITGREGSGGSGPSRARFARRLRRTLPLDRPRAAGKKAPMSSTPLPRVPFPNPARTHHLPRAKGDISIMQPMGHFYFALTPVPEKVSPKKLHLTSPTLKRSSRRSA
jgi:hypothetical protein